MDTKSLQFNKNIIAELGETWNSPEEFDRLGKTYIDQYSSYKRNIEEQNSVVYYQGLIKNFRDFESIFSFYDDIQKYPDSGLHKEFLTKIDDSINSIDSIFENRVNFSEPQIKLGKPPATEEVIPEFDEEALPMRYPVKQLNIININELKTIEDHKLDDITELKICLHAGGVKDTDVIFVKRV